MPSNDNAPPRGGEKACDGADSGARDNQPPDLSRRRFIKGAGIAGVAASAGALLADRTLAVEPESQNGGTGGAPGVLGPGAVPVTLKINGKLHRLSLEPRVTLLDALRNHLDLTGAKKVCDRATCGACTVHLDGRAVYSCTTLALDAQGHEITTIEGIEPAGGLHPVSQAFWDHDAQQCGFCTPGFVMAVTAYLNHQPNPTLEALGHALGGNLCRCGTYRGIKGAVLEAARSIRAKGGQA